MCKNKIRRYELIEFKVPQEATTKIMFENMPELNKPGTVIQDIEVFTDTVMPKTPSQGTNAPIEELKKAVLVLIVGGQQFIHQLPLVKLIRINDGVNPYQEQFEGLDDLKNVDWSKSYVMFSSAPAGPYKILFGVNYSYTSTR